MATYTALEASRILTEFMELESDGAYCSSCPESDADLDEEREHFEFRIDPAEDEAPLQTGNHQATPPTERARSRLEDLENHDPNPQRSRSGRAPLQTGNHQATPPTVRARSQSRSGRAPKRPRVSTRPSTPASQPSTAWKTETDPDVVPLVSRFQPARPPGVQLNSADNHTPLDLFKLFVSRDAVKTLCQNTNKQAAMAQAKETKYKWTDVTVKEFYKYIGLLFYMAMVKLNNIQDYWRQNSIFSVQFPATVMCRERYRTISWNVHMSDPDKDRENDRKKGTPQYDKLFKLRPFMNTIQTACKSFFHPRRNISVDERMVAWKANSGMTQFMKEKPTKWGFKLFVLCDSSNGYTVDFSVYPGKNYNQVKGGLTYDTVMSLVNPNYLGSGYHVYMDNFYTSPKLFRDLLALNIGACGTYRDNRKDCPRTESNALTQKSPRGSIRWLRDGPLVFVKWVDTKIVPVCSTIHAAFAGDTIQRRVKQCGVWISKDFPCPSPITDYNKNMGGVDLSDQLLQYYTAQHKTMKWYRKLFLHFLDIAATNAYLLHKELVSLGQGKAMSHKAFQEELVAQLCGVSQKIPPTRATCDHLSVPIVTQPLNVRDVSNAGWLKCIVCRTNGKQMGTPWKCKACDVPLCLQLTRNCFEKWHSSETPV